MKNLAKIIIPARFNLSRDIAEMVNRAKADTYAISMPLIIAGYAGFNQYDTIKDIMEISVDAMQDFDKRSFKAWMLGRLIQAEMTMGNDVTKRVDELKKLLMALSHEVEGADRFETWAWGYLAYADYDYAKKSMMQCIVELKGSLADRLWALVMAVQASAHAKDKNIYDACLIEIKNIIQKPTVGDALATGLSRNEASKNNDFPSWALAIVYASAQMMRHNDLMIELEPVLKRSIEESKQIVAACQNQNPEFANKVLAEQRLAEVIFSLAQENQKELVAERASAYVPK